jgi:hypothetical protein
MFPTLPVTSGWYSGYLTRITRPVRERGCSQAKGRDVWIGKDVLAPGWASRDGPPPWPYCR